MRYLHILLLKLDGTTEWRTIPWGKRHLDWHRREGDIVYSTVVYS